MSEALIAYHSTLLACVALSVLVTLQVLVADLAAIKTGHVPGMPVTSGHANFHFRAVRAIGNTNETLALTLMLVVLAIVLGANPKWTNALAWVYVAGRAGHMAFYYAKLGLARSTAFGVSLLATVGLLVAVVAAVL
jgi:uncharacterized MAPEG superfamily protein